MRVVDRLHDYCRLQTTRLDYRRTVSYENLARLIWKGKEEKGVGC